MRGDDAAAREPDAPTFLPLDSFVVPGHDFIVSTGQDVYVMSAAHAHSQIELNFMLEGAATYLHGGREATIRAGDFALFWGAIAHRTTAVEPGSRYVCIYLPLEMFLAAPLSEPLRAAALAGGLLVAADPKRFEASRFQRLVEGVRAPAPPGIGELLAAEVLLILRWLDVSGWRDLLAGEHARARPAAGVMPRKVLEMMGFVADNAHRPISVTDVAEAVALHPNYAMTRFRTALGLTIQAYIGRHRLMAAQSLVLSTKKDLAAIAFETGFGSVSQFHRSFRAQFGCTPAEFRRRMRLPTARAV
jgi:AraC family transcriptional regulator, melibiose operon regulatory protein